MNQKTIQKMIENGALVLPPEILGLTVKASINFKIVQQKFPEYLEELILYQLNWVEQWSYKNGLMAYYINNDGDLMWRPTNKSKGLFLS